MNVLTFEQIKELIEIVTHNRLQRVEIERSGFRLVIDGQETARVEHVAPAEAPVAEATPPPAPAPAAEPATAAPAAPAEEEAPADDGLHVLHSPIVGTFYSAPNPEADAFVSVGDRVKAGQVLCIVEAMKLMNEIESDVDGTLRQIHPQNAQPVEFGEALFSIELD
jgi:acetyl-CoA carboxylase biotin carboxyl carrier protein